MDAFEFRELGNSGVDEDIEQLAQKVIGAAIEVHRLIKPGMPENVYKRAMSRELTLRGIPHECEVHFPIVYKGEQVGEGFIDILADRRLILELKSVDHLSEVHRAQAIGYLQALNLKLALLLNFNVPQMKQGIKRVINTFL